MSGCLTTLIFMFSELLAEQNRLVEQKAAEEQQKQVHSDDDEESDSDSEVDTIQLKRRRDNDSDMEIDETKEEEVKKPTWKAIGEEEPTSSKYASDAKSVRGYRRRKHVSSFHIVCLICERLSGRRHRSVRNRLPKCFGRRT